MLRSILISSFMVVLVVAISGALTALLSRRFNWSGRGRNAMAAVIGSLCWLAWVYASKLLLGEEPFAELSQNLSNGWVGFIQNLSLLVPLGFAPVVADSLFKARYGGIQTTSREAGK